MSMSAFCTGTRTPVGDVDLHTRGVAYARGAVECVDGNAVRDRPGWQHRGERGEIDFEGGRVDRAGIGAHDARANARGRACAARRYDHGPRRPR